MTNRTGAYVPLSAQYYMDDRIDAAGEAAELLYIRGLAFSAGLFADGVLTRSQVFKGAGIGLNKMEDRVTALTESGLWIPEEDGAKFRIRSWLKWNRTRAEIEAARERDAARKRPRRGGSPGRVAESPPNGLRSESARTPNGVRTESARPDTEATTDVPFGPFGSKTERTGVGAGAYAREAAPAEAAAQEPPRPAPEPEPDRPSPRYEPPSPETAAEIAAILSRATNRRLARRAADGFGAP